MAAITDAVVKIVPRNIVLVFDKPGKLEPWSDRVGYRSLSGLINPVPNNVDAWIESRPMRSEFREVESFMVADNIFPYVYNGELHKDAFAPDIRLRLFRTDSRGYAFLEPVDKA